MSDVIIRIDDVYKQYRLGSIGGRTFQEDVQNLTARLLHKEDPNLKIGSENNAVKRHERFYALSGVSFDVYKGDTLGVIGQNGAGKSTLLKLLSRVTAPTKGSISYNGRISSMLEVGTGFHPELTGRENVYLNGAILGMSKAEIDRKFDEIVEFAELTQFIDTPVKRYSSGMYVKLAFSVSAHLDADILVMDEVLAVGDVKFQQKCLQKMGAVASNEGRTVLYVSHNMATIRQLCNRCVVLDKGTLKYDGDVSTGIEAYLSNQDTTQRVFNDFTDVARPSFKYGGRATLKSLELIGKDNNYFVNDEKLSFYLTCENSEDTDELHLHFIVKTMDDIPIATFLSPDVFSAKKDQTTKFKVTLDISEIVSGSYKMDIVLLKANHICNFIHYDTVNPALCFTKERSLGTTYTISWKPQNRGYIQGQGITIEEV